MFGNLFTPRYATSSLFPDGMDMHTYSMGSRRRSHLP